METVLHLLGACGDIHPKLVDLGFYFQYLIENKRTLAYTLSNTWQNLLN